MAKKSVKKPKKDDDRKLFAFLATFLSIVGFIIALATKKNDKYVMHYAKQSLVIFLVFLLGWIVMIVPLIGWVIGPIVDIIGLVFWVISWIYALTGEVKEVPIVGKYAKSINL